VPYSRLSRGGIFYQTGQTNMVSKRKPAGIRKRVFGGSGYISNAKVQRATRTTRAMSYFFS
jgi:hypothetical protein